nr:MAG TPA: hypothetical protein [Caudoviricetes sp.]
MPVTAKLSIHLRWLLQSLEPLTLEVNKHESNNRKRT